jgi:hypothetical protein
LVGLDFGAIIDPTAAPAGLRWQFTTGGAWTPPAVWTVEGRPRAAAGGGLAVGVEGVGDGVPGVMPLALILVCSTSSGRCLTAGRPRAPPLRSARGPRPVRWGVR